MTVGERIQDLRKKKGYTQERLAAHLNLSRQAVAKWEQNACEPNLDCLVAMAELFEVDLDYLIAGKASDNATEKAPVTAGKEKKKRPPMSKKQKTAFISVIAAVIALAVVVDTLAMIVLGVGGVAGYLYMASEMEGSEGLEFAKRADGTYNVYVGECTDTDVVIPRRGPDGSLVTFISGFKREFHITSVTIPDSVTQIGFAAFSECTSLTSITIPDSVTSIGDDAFKGCTSLTSITLPDSVTTIGRSAFFGCSSLKSITIPKGMTTIGISAFAGLTALESVTIPEGVKTLESSAFSGCESLKEIKIPDSVTNIDKHSFFGCESVTSITVGANNPAYSSDGNCLINKASKTLMMAGKDYTIPNDGSVTSIGDRAFYNRADIESIKIPDCVTSIGDFAFTSCNNLTSVTIPGSVTSVGRNAFSDCEGLTSVIMLDGVTEIDENAFDGCKNLASVTIPATVTHIGFAAFYGCSNLKEVNYAGTKEQWKAITIDMCNSDLNSFQYIHCSDGDLYV